VVAAAFSAWALVVVGGLVRVSESGLGCPDWPLCDGRVVPDGQKEPLIEYAHRATAAVTIVVLVAVTVVAWRRYRSHLDVFVPLAVALGLVPLQAVIGAAVVWLELPDRLVGVHFMVGMVMLGLCTYAAVAAWRGSRPVSQTFRRFAVAAGAAGLLLVSLGAGVVTTDAMHACGEQWPGCNGGVASGGDLAVLQVVHRSVAYAVVALALVLLVLGVRGQAPLLASCAPAALALAQLGVGIGMVLSGHGSLQHDVLRVLHVAGAAGVWASMAAVVAASMTARSGARRGMLRVATLAPAPATAVESRSGSS
jgi:heme A synthase